jgi:macrolide-specific efflux system membrane fusion protein
MLGLSGCVQQADDSPVQAGARAGSPTGSLAGAPARAGSSQPLIADVVAVGIVKSQVGAEVKVGSQLSGVVAKLHVNVGDAVQRGDALAELDDAQWQARATSLEAELAAAVAELAYANADVSRMERVASFSPSQVENGRRNAQVREAMVEQARARLAEARVQLGYTRIRAPIAGTVASVSTYEGETVAAAFSAPTFVTIVDLDRLELQAYVDEHDIGSVRAGDRVRFRVDAFRTLEWSGVVRAIYPKPQLVNNVVNYIVVVDFQRPKDAVVRPEMTAHVTFSSGDTREARR